jgi:serine protease 16
MRLCAVVRAVVVCVCVAAAACAPRARYLQQRQDHFDGGNANTWPQAYYVNDSQWLPGSRAPVFLCIGGEGPPLDGSVVTASPHCNDAVEWLPETGAIMFAVEHRYYGCHNMSACPVSSFSSLDDLRFLSSAQALEDLALFIAYATAAYNLTGSQWVAWGGRYSIGTVTILLATLARYRSHPLQLPGHAGGLAAVEVPPPCGRRRRLQRACAHRRRNAGVTPRYCDPFVCAHTRRRYNDAVAAAFAVEHESVGGSSACEAAIREGHRAITGLTTDATGRQRLASLFGHSADWCCAFSFTSECSASDFDVVRRYESAANVVAFAGGGVAVFDPQDNDVACLQPCCNISGICRVMLDTGLGDYVDRLAVVARLQNVTFDEGRSRIAAAAAASHLGRSWHMPHVTRHAPSRPALRHSLPDFWSYQTCAEFGGYMTCDVGSRCFFSQGLLTLPMLMSFCPETFNISFEEVSSNIAATNTRYGGAAPAASCVIYANGEIDPFAPMGVLESSPDRSLFAFVVQGAPHVSRPRACVRCTRRCVTQPAGASHHAWTHPSSSSDQRSVASARIKIRQLVQQMLGSGECARTFEKPPQPRVAETKR